MRKAIACFFFLFAFSSVVAQESFLTFDWFNDGQAIPPLDDDRWFTNGLSMRYGLPLFKKAPAPNGASRREGEAKPETAAPTAQERSPLETAEESGVAERSAVDASTAEGAAADSEKNAEKLALPPPDPWYWIVFAIAQNMYTPMDILPTVPQYDDRPYAGWSRFGWAIYRQKELNFKSLEISIGMLGEAGAGVTQTTVHEFVKARHPGGWEHHIEDRFAFQGIFINRDDRYPLCAGWGKSDFYWLAYSFGYGIDVGNVFMGADFSMEGKLGRFRVSPRHSNSKPGLRAVKNPSSCPFEFFLYAAPQIAAICYNGTLVHGSDPGYDITMVPLVFRLEVGAQIDVVNTFCPKSSWRRVFLRWSPFYYSSPDFAVDNEWPFSLKESFLESCNTVGRWYIGCSWN